MSEDKGKAKVDALAQRGVDAAARMKPKGKRGPGRSTLLNRRLIQHFVDVLRSTSTPIAVMAEAAGISRQSFFRWMANGEAAVDPDPNTQLGLEKELWVAVTRARAEGTETTLAQIRKLALEQKDLRGLTWELERTRPKEFGPRVRIHVEEELTELWKLLRQEFKDEPAIWERIARVIAGEVSPEDSNPGDDT